MLMQFGMEGCVVIDMVVKIGVEMEIVYFDMMFFFFEIYELCDCLVKKYMNLIFVNCGIEFMFEQQEKEYGLEFWKFNFDLCCYICKVELMKVFMDDVDVWIISL